MKTKKQLLVFLAMICTVTGFLFLKLRPNQAEISAYNLVMCQKYENEIFTCIAYVEDFGKGKNLNRFDPDFMSAPYFCGVRWTNGYGSTVYPKGSPIKKGDRKMSKAYGRKCAVAHLQKRVYPFICRYVTRKLSKTEIIGTCMFVYNIGGEAFSGHKANGAKKGNPCKFLIALNKHKNLDYCARRMTGFRAAGGSTAKGLLKRHWVQAAIFCGYLTAEDLLKLKPSSFYSIRNLNRLYVEPTSSRNGFLTYKHDEETLEWFKKTFASNDNTYKILDEEMQNYFASAI